MPTQLCDEIIDVYENIFKTQPSHVLRSDVGELLEVNINYRDDRFICLDEAAPWCSELPRLVNEHITRALYEYFEYFPVLNTDNSGLYSIRQKLQKTDVAGGFHAWHYENGGIDSASRLVPAQDVHFFCTRSHLSALQNCAVLFSTNF